MRAIGAAPAAGALMAGLIFGQTSLAQSQAASPSPGDSPRPAAASPSRAADRPRLAAMSPSLAAMRPPPAAVSAPPAAVSAPPVADSATWMPVDSPLLGTLDTIEHATTIGTELVVIGTRCDAEGVCARIALASSDGFAWDERGALPEDVELLGDLITHEDVLIAAGRDADGDGAIWRSGDAGATWEAVGEPGAFRPGADGRPGRSPSGNRYEVTVLSVARGTAGLVAGGWLDGEDADRSALWHSADGEGWERIRLPRAMDRAGGVFDIAGTDESYVAVTSDGLWRSADGRSWSRATPDGAGPITDVAATPAGFTAITVGPPVATAWEAGPIGTGWQRRPDDAALAGVWEADLRPLGSSVLAFGSRTGEQLHPTVWTLRPGSTWTVETVTDEPGAHLQDVAEIGDRLFAMGSVEDAEGNPTAIVWLRSDPAS